MIIVCPSCDAKFNVDDDLVAAGRKVRCSECHHIWFYDTAADETAESAIDTDSHSDTDDDGDMDMTENALSASIPGNLHPADDEYYNPQDENLTVLPVKKKQSDTDGDKGKGSFSVAGVLFVFLCLFGATLAYSLGAKASVVKTWQPVALLYDAIGLTIPHAGQGLEVTNLVAKRSMVRGEDVLYIRGRIDNITDKAMVIPQLRVVLQDGDTVVQQWNTPEENFEIGKGESIPFEYGLPGPSGQGSTVSIYFIDGEQP